MRPVAITQSATGFSSPVVLDPKTVPFNVGIGCTVSGTGTYTVQFTFDDPASFASAAAYNSNATWQNHATLVTQSSTNNGNIAFPVRAVRNNVTALSSGTVTITIIQAGRMG